MSVRNGVLGAVTQAVNGARWLEQIIVKNFDEPQLIPVVA